MSTYPGATAIINIMGIKPGEHVLILSDQKASAEAIAIVTRFFSDYGAFPSVNWDLPLTFADELPEWVELMVKESDVVIFAASQSWYHTNARKKAKHKWRKRVAECYGLVMESLLDGGLTADYSQVERKGEELSSIFQGGLPLRVVSDGGTNFTCNIMDVGFETGQYQQPGSGGNLPGGEVYIIPSPGSVNGKVIFDVSMDLYGSFNEDTIGIDMKDGKIVNVSGANESVLRKTVQQDHRVTHVAEIAFGTNAWSKLGQSILEDEKKLGTAHVGFGNDTYFGGKNNGPHYDGIFSNPRVVSGNGKEIILG